MLVGTWTHGLFVVGQTPFALGKIANLPTMRGKKAACFLTFALNAGKSIDKLSTAVGQTGAEVVGGLEIKRNYIDQHTDLFVERLLGVVEPSVAARAVASAATWRGVSSSLAGEVLGHDVVVVVLGSSAGRGRRSSARTSTA